MSRAQPPGLGKDPGHPARTSRCRPGRASGTPPQPDPSLATLGQADISEAAPPLRRGTDEPGLPVVSVRLSCLGSFGGMG